MVFPYSVLWVGLSLLSSSKSSPIPHAYIRLSDPKKQLTQGMGYGVDVDLELVQPRRSDSEESCKSDEVTTTATSLGLFCRTCMAHRRFSHASVESILLFPVRLLTSPLSHSTGYACWALNSTRERLARCWRM